MKRRAGRACGAIALCSLLAGCAGDLFRSGPPQVTFDFGAAAVIYADSKAAYAVAASKIGAACRAGRIDAEDCKQLAAIADQAKIVDAQVKQILRNPTVPVDWDRVMEFSSFAAGLLLRLVP